MRKRIAVIAGDGIGIDVTKEGIKVLKAISEKCRYNFEIKEYDYGAEKYLREGITFPESAKEEMREYDAILLGALGDPRVPDMKHAADILFGIRFGLDLYVNFRPIKLYHEKLCPLKNRGVEDINFVVFRENTEGLYSGMGGIFKKGTPDEIAIQEDVNTRKGVERIIRYAFEYCQQKKLKTLHMADKSNALRYGHDLWQRVFWEVAKEYPEIEAKHYYIDACTMQMVKNPKQFQAIVTCNMFGDIITDLGAQLQGGLGIAASANINPNGVCMFEPVHGSAPKYAGKNIANPFGSILSCALMLEYWKMYEEANLIEKAVIRAIEIDYTTPDLGGKYGTTEVGDFISKYILEG